ncbi:arabinan endo-1,5-alpha-L-arabinosidase [Sporothrix schenckii 1099-18]|uniref:Arabinan endo-1,5-alpha-L-arabinosidase n=2 Tax=Sporothrix schenckii TaxID=29908 RepID=U7PNS0_SPOS1|nr:arabinan endo-1,5-alpha-L-arabinosidase [Sporothrix schenckii 1099-18]ERS97288.1 hypothetical protein HMPREF1624_06620 [Sporothrix schenckii ATCC 58251]KJR86526.1 arabinan endo-1,5-alpha-L-arabinosidase [Sporothrix schenckii 1099-18]
MRSLVSSAAVLLAGAGIAAAYPNPEGCTGDCFTHDPAVARRDDGTYFRFSTLDLISIRTAPSLSGPWTVAGSVVQGRSVINMDGNDVLWAPDVSYIRGLYYCLYAVSTSGSHISAIGYATSSTMDPGSWTDQGEILTSSNSSPYNAIDASLVNGTGPDEFYMTWGSYWGDIYQAAAAVDTTYIYPSGNQKQIAYNTPSNGNYEEGAYTYYHDGFFYLFLSVGHCCSYDPKPAAGTEYHVVVCRSASVTGPYVDESGVACTAGGGTTILASHDEVYAPGGQGVFHDPVHGDVLYYHYLNTSIGVDYDHSQFGWNVIHWGANGWPSL